MSVIRMLVLGVVSQRGRIHGYGVQRELAEWRVETWTRVRPGSLYHALRQLTEEGKLRVTASEAGDPGQGRPVYEITAAGTAELVALVERALTSVDPEQLSAGVALMAVVPRGRVIDLLREQHRLATGNRRHLDELAQQAPDQPGPPHRTDLLGLWSSLLGATADWTAGLIRRLEDDGYDSGIAPAPEAGGTEAAMDREPDPARSGGRAEPAGKRVDR